MRSPGVDAERHRQNSAVLGSHSGPPHRPAASVSDLANIPDASDRRVTVSEEERNLVHALAGELRPEIER
jgi:hypothetical protein